MKQKALDSTTERVFFVGVCVCVLWGGDEERSCREKQLAMKRKRKKTADTSIEWSLTSLNCCSKGRQGGPSTRTREQVNHVSETSRIWLCHSNSGAIAEHP